MRLEYLYLKYDGMIILVEDIIVDENSIIVTGIGVSDTYYTNEYRLEASINALSMIHISNREEFIKVFEG